MDSLNKVHIYKHVVFLVATTGRYRCLYREITT